MADYNSLYTGEQIDNAIGRALPNGDLDKKISEKGALITEKPSGDAFLLRDSAGAFSYGYFFNKGLKVVSTGQQSKDIYVDAIYANSGTIKTTIQFLTSAQFAGITVKDPSVLYFITE